MNKLQELDKLLARMRDDLTCGASEIAMQAMSIYRMLLSQPLETDTAQAKALLAHATQEMIKTQPAMAPVFNLGNQILMSAEKAKTTEQIARTCINTLDQFEKDLGTNASKIADFVYELIPAGQTVFAYSFSSTVVSSLLNARAQKKYFRVMCTEVRPSKEGRKLAAMLSSAGVDVTHTFDPAMGLVLPSCQLALMGCDAAGRYGIVNKAGSWLLALACQELNIPLYVLGGSEKFAEDAQLLAFEEDERPGEEIWNDAPSSIHVVNKQYELLPFRYMSGLVTEHGILQASDMERYLNAQKIHPALQGKKPSST